MRKSLLKDITIYHKEKDKYSRFNIKASVRNNTNLTRSGNSLMINDSLLIRIFDIKGYKRDWFIDLKDVICLKRVDDDIINAPITELRAKYGKEHVIEVSDIEEFIFDDKDIKKLNHVKIQGK